TLAYTKVHALVFVTVVMVVGLAARGATRGYAARHPRPSLLRRAILEQLPPDALARRRFMVGTYGSEALAPAAPAFAARHRAAVHGCERVLIGTSRRGPLHQIIKGSFQRQLEHLLPPAVPVQVLGVDPSAVVDRSELAMPAAAGPAAAAGAADGGV